MKKWLVIWLLILCFCTPSNCQSEDQLISIEFDNISLSSALSLLDKVSTYRFAFSNSILKSYNVNAQFTESTLSTILDEIIPPEFTYSAQGKLYIIYKEDSNSKSDSASEKQMFSVSGKVVDLQKNEPLPYAYLRVPSNNVIAECDENGHFIIHQIPSDTAKIIASYIGYEQKTFYLNPGIDTANIIIYMTREDFLSQATVSPKDFPIVSKEEPLKNEINVFKTSQVTNVGETDALVLLKYLPGFNPSADGDLSYSYHGLKPSENAYILDGVSLLNPTHFYGLFSSINSLSTKNISVSKSNFSSEYGGRIGTLIDIQTLDGNTPEPNIQLKTGLLSSSATFGSQILNKKASIFLAGRRSHSPFLKPLLFNPLINSLYNSNISFVGDIGAIDIGNSSADAEVFFSDFQSKLTINPNPRIKLALSGNYNDDLTEQFFGDEIENLDLNIAYTTEVFWRNSGVSGKADFQLSPALWLRSISSFNKLTNLSNSREDITDLIFNENQTLQSSYDLYLTDLSQKLKLDYSISDSLKLILGGELNSYNLSTSESTFSFPIDSSEKQAKVNSAFTQLTYKNFKTNIDAGIRVSSFSGELFAAPRIKYTLHLRPNTSFKLSYGKQIQYLRKLTPFNPFLESIDRWDLASSDLPTTQKTTFSIGFFGRSKNLTWNAEFSNSNQKNAIENLNLLISQANTNITESSDFIIGDYETNSLDLAVQYVLNKHYLSLSYGFNNSNGNFEIDSTETMFRNPRISTHNLTGIWLWSSPKWSTSASIIYASGKPVTPALGSYVLPLANNTYRPFIVFGDINSDSTPAYFRADISGSYKFHLKRNSFFEISLAIQNVFNTANLKFQSNTTIETSNPEEFLILSRRINHLSRVSSVFLTLNF